MRQILFRAKRADNGEWAEGCFRYVFAPLGGDDRLVICPGRCHESDGWTDTGEAVVVESTVGQFIGQRDKDGMPIFEADIVDTSDGLRGVILWDDGRACFVTKPCRRDPYPVLWMARRGKVVGNIHDNPDLYEGGGDARETLKRVR